MSKYIQPFIQKTSRTITTLSSPYDKGTGKESQRKLKTNAKSIWKESVKKAHGSIENFERTQQIKIIG